MGGKGREVSKGNGSSIVGEGRGVSRGEEERRGRKWNSE